MKRMYEVTINHDRDNQIRVDEATFIALFHANTLDGDMVRIIDGHYSLTVYARDAYEAAMNALLDNAYMQYNRQRVRSERNEERQHIEYLLAKERAEQRYESRDYEVDLE